MNYRDLMEKIYRKMKFHGNARSTKAKYKKLNPKYLEMKGDGKT